MPLNSDKAERKKRILLLSGYDAASHRYWRRLLAEQLTQFEWVQLALPDRHFSWRVRGSSLEFAFQFQNEISGDFDIVIATSMVDLASLRGFVPSLANIPTIVYFHENQFVYPVSSAQPNIVNAQLTSIYSALCADCIVFNSRYNAETFHQGATELFRRLPGNKNTHVVEQLIEKSSVIPVPIVFPETQAENSNEEPLSEQKDHLQTIPQILWNHRWEYDKQPEVFFAALAILKEREIRFKLHVLGQSFRKIPSCFNDAESDFADEIETFGFQSTERYRQILASSDVVVSTALHDFQGLSLQQAISHGCTPVAPDRVAYPEYIPGQFLYSVKGTERNEAQSVANKLIEVLVLNEPCRINLEKYRAPQTIKNYLKLIDKLIIS